MKAADMTDLTSANIRYVKASRIASWLMRTLDDTIPRACQREAHAKILELLMADGVDILTDEDRRRAGLPPRGPKGWTDVELHALEYANLHAISAPFASALKTGEQTVRQSSDLNMSDGRKTVGKMSENPTLDIEN